MVDLTNTNNCYKNKYVNSTNQSCSVGTCSSLSSILLGTYPSIAFGNSLYP